MKWNLYLKHFTNRENVISHGNAMNRISKLVDQWIKDPESFNTEENEIERADAVTELFEIPDEFRQEELDEIRARHAAARANAHASA